MPLSNLEREIGRRVAQRMRCELVVEVRDGAGARLRALLADYSASGFRLSHVRGSLAGSSVWLCPEGLEPIAAKIRWRGTNGVGCQFLFPLDEAILSDLATAADATGGKCAAVPMAMMAEV